MRLSAIQCKIAPVVAQLQRIWATRPLLANSATGWCLFAAGDAASQAVPAAWGAHSVATSPVSHEHECHEESRSSVDWERSAKVGAFVHAY